MVSHLPDLLSETQCHLVSSVLQFVLVALEVPEDLVHPEVHEDGSLSEAIQAKITCLSVLKVINKNIILITYSLFHLWVLGNSNPYYPAKSITHQPLEVTNEQKEKKKTTNAKPNAPPALSIKERQYLRSWQPWWTRRSLLKKETKPSHFQVLYMPLFWGEKHPNHRHKPKITSDATLTPAHYICIDKTPCLPLSYSSCYSTSEIPKKLALPFK